MGKRQPAWPLGGSHPRTGHGASLVPAPERLGTVSDDFGMFSARFGLRPVWAASGPSTGPLRLDAGGGRTLQGTGGPAT